MKKIHSILHFFVLKTVIAQAQVVQTQQTTSNSNIPSAAVVQESFSPVAANANQNAVGFNDRNRGLRIFSFLNSFSLYLAGFNPFEIGPQKKFIGAKVLLAVMTVASVIASLVITLPWGVLAAMVLQGGAFMFQPYPPNPNEVYESTYGKIQNQINTAINNKVISCLSTKSDFCRKFLN